MKTSGLGRGLSALIGESSEAPIIQNDSNEKSSKKQITNDENAEYIYVNPNSIEPNPFQPRMEFDEVSIDELAASIDRSGFIAPLTVKKSPKQGEYILIAGERRLRACKKLGLKEIPVVVKNLTDAQMMQIAIIENVQRKSLNPIEEANAYQNMMTHLRLDPNAIAKMLGLPLFYVMQKLKLIQLPDVVQRYVISKELSEGAAITLLHLESEDAIIAASKIAVRQNMTRAAVEKLVEKILLSKGIQQKPNNYDYSSKYQYLTDTFKDTMGWKMNIKNLKQGRGKIEIEFLDEIELRDIYNQLEKILREKK